MDMDKWYSYISLAGIHNQSLIGEERMAVKVA